MKTKVSKISKSEIMKVCTKCSKEKPLDEFGSLKASKDGHMSICKECNRERSKNFAKLVRKTIKVAKEEYDWTTAPMYTHEVRKGNDCVIGDYFKNKNRVGNFILKIVVWDFNNNGEKVTVETHRLFVKEEDWKKMLNFSHFDVMQHDLFNANDQTWKSFVETYSKKFNEENPDSLIGLRFKKHGTNGMQVNCGFNLKSIPVLETKFAG
jgi:hypothetical protein